MPPGRELVRGGWSRAIAAGGRGEASPEQIARRFKRARVTTVQPLLDSLTAIGGAHQTEEGRYAA